MSRVQEVNQGLTHAQVVLSLMAAHLLNMCQLYVVKVFYMYYNGFSHINRTQSSPRRICASLAYYYLGLCGFIYRFFICYYL